MRMQIVLQLNYYSTADKMKKFRIYSARGIHDLFSEQHGKRHTQALLFPEGKSRLVWRVSQHTKTTKYPTCMRTLNLPVTAILPGSSGAFAKSSLPWKPPSSTFTLLGSMDCYLIPPWPEQLLRNNSASSGNSSMDCYVTVDSCYVTTQWTFGEAIPLSR